MSVALITGASSGMGRELALQLASRNWTVVASMREPARASAELAANPNVNVIQLDVTDSNSIESAVKWIETTVGPISALVNNAGFAQYGSLEEVSPEQWLKQYDTNVMGIVRVLDAVLPGMRERRAGHILNISSMGGHVALPTMTAYTSSKFAVEGLSEGLAKEVAGLGIKVTIVEPCGMGTNFLANAGQPECLLADYDQARDAMKAFSAGSRWGDVERGMSAVADLIGSEDAPLRFAVGSYGLEMVRGKMADLTREYDAWEHVTMTTD
ncbi:SDR family NAD(P)-dependent oxidoreductase [Rhodococcus wratislaviensis]|uniref:Putative oxidoreductase n=1 Tax=Rhodococcus wratislaviensis NBRC 100605 TaxID=1219028 RepID=X0Q9N1_RHOWR|nr:SDR family NAD(P)-dependent oxidoreductase [Rhodococcus wratislaviensis]GAF47621.1 putative oxidoreductase [Rhodococcus wratislaviensis NBRC 100605]